MHRRWMAPVAAVLAVLVVAAPAVAAGPQITRWTDTLALADLDCGDGTVYDLTLDGRFIEEDFGDSLVLHQVIDGEAVSNDGTRIEIHYAWTDRLAFGADTLTLTGMPFGIRVVGEEALRTQDRGHLVVDLATFTVVSSSAGFSFQAGDLFAPDPHGATCELFAAAG